MKKTIAISIISTLCATSLVAWAQPDGEGAGSACGPKGKAHLFEKADENSDGKVTLDEALAAANAHFDKADQNKDGKVTPEERAAAHRARAEARFDKADQNKDGVLTEDELSGKRARFMMRADQNEDGQLTKAELKAAHEARLARKQARAEKRGGQGPGGKFNETHTKADVQAFVTERFNKLDANADGVVTQEEFAQGWKGHHRRGGKGPWGKAREGSDSRQG